VQIALRAMFYEGVAQDTFEPCFIKKVKRMPERRPPLLVVDIRACEMIVLCWRP
jgi:hypothetical protein